jgi:hypothetical protein
MQIPISEILPRLFMIPWSGVTYVTNSVQGITVSSSPIDGVGFVLLCVCAFALVIRAFGGASSRV